MATQTLEVVVENGAFRPVSGVLPFSEGQHVRVVVEIEEKLETPPQSKPMIFGLHAGMGEMTDDFDDQLPDAFWMGEE